MFFELLNIKTSDWYKTFIAGRRLTSEHPPYTFFDSRKEKFHGRYLYPPLVYRKTRDEPTRKPNGQETQQERPHQHQLVKLTDQFLALLVMVLTKAGLCEVRLSHTLNLRSFTESLGTYMPP
jgi:large subunit ribosomal protein L17e